MIENVNFKLLAENKGLRAAAAKRGLGISFCGNAFVLSNQFYGFFFMDVLNEGTLYAWLVDRRSVKQTLTLNRLIANNYKLVDYKKTVTRFLSNIKEDSSEVKIVGKEKLAEFLLYTELIGERLGGIETGTIDLQANAWHSISDHNWAEWDKSFSCKKLGT